jgi:hypothetical protein
VTDLEARRAFQALVKAEFVPALEALGFRRTETSFAARPLDAPFPNTFARDREDYVDEVHIRWRSRLQPMFILEFWTDQTERMLNPDRRPLPPGKRYPRSHYVQMYPRPIRVRKWHGLWDGWAQPTWFGEGMTQAEAIERAKARLAELDHYLKVGAPMPCMRLVDDVLVKRGEPSNARPAPPAGDAP